MISRLSARTGFLARICAAIFILFVAQAACAAELGFYVAGFYGEAMREPADKAQFDALATDIYAQFGFTPVSTVSSLGDDSDTAFGMAGGYRLLPNLALEVSYMDLGELRYRNDSFGTHIDHQEPWRQKLDLKLKGFTLSALGVLPLSYRWEAYARAGVLFASNELNLHITDFFSARDAEASSSSTELLAGLGATFSFAEVYGARFEYQRIFDAGDGLAENDVDVVSIGFMVSF